MKSTPHLPSRLYPIIALADGLSALAGESSRRLGHAWHRRTRPRVGATLRPGPQTPRWNELVGALRPWLGRRGAKTMLARILGVPRQRVHDFIVGRGRMPDAERTLRLLEWLAARQRGVKPA